MFKLAILVSSFSLVACATGSSLGIGHEVAPRTGLSLDLSGGNSTQMAFPAAIDPAVPSVDRISRAVFATLGDTATAELDLCVAPSGKIVKLALVKSSSMAELDAALLNDAQSWRFEAMPGPDTVQMCRHANVTYRPY